MSRKISVNYFHGFYRWVFGIRRGGSVEVMLVEVIYIASNRYYLLYDILSILGIIIRKKRVE